jgi:hypothetical protein
LTNALVIILDSTAADNEFAFINNCAMTLARKRDVVVRIYLVVGLDGGPLRGESGGQRCSESASVLGARRIVTHDY